MPSDDGLGYWEANAARYDWSMRVLGGPMPAMIARVVGAVTGAGRVLELGAGTGLVTTAMAPVVTELVATDYAPAMEAQLAARTRGLSNVTTRVLDVDHMTEPPGSFDALVATNVLHLLPNLKNALEAMSRVVRQGGHLILPTYLHDATRASRAASLVLRATGFPGRRRFTLATLRAAIEGDGRSVVAAEQLDGLIPIGFVVAEVR